MSKANEVTTTKNDLLDTDCGVLLLRREEIAHDFQTISSYPEYVASECTCGYHAPPPGLCERPGAHVEHCEFRTNRLRNADNLGQRLIGG